MGRPSRAAPRSIVTEVAALGCVTSLVGVFLVSDHYLGYPFVGIVLGAVFLAIEWSVPSSLWALAGVLLIAGVGLVVNQRWHGSWGNRSPRNFVVHFVVSVVMFWLWLGIAIGLHALQN
jgi:hypothetical protein